MPKLTSACCVAVDVESVDTVVPNPMQAPWIRSPHAGKGPCDPGAAVPDACASDPSRRQRALLRDYGVAGDLYVAAQDAVRAMIDHLVTSYALTPEDAYLLCSIAVDLKISEIVDGGQYIVSALLPEAVFAFAAAAHSGGRVTPVVRTRPRGGCRVTVVWPGGRQPARGRDVGAA